MVQVGDVRADVGRRRPRLRVQYQSGLAEDAEQLARAADMEAKHLAGIDRAITGAGPT